MANQAKSGTRGQRIGAYLVSGVCGAICVGIVVVGIYAMAHKPKSKPTPPPTSKSAAIYRPRLAHETGRLGAVSQAPPSGDGLAVPFLVDPEHADVAQHVAEKRFFWVDLQGPVRTSELNKFAELIGLHPLTVEDAKTFDQRPKFDEYEGYVFLVACGVDPGASVGPVRYCARVHLVVSGEYVVDDPQGRRSGALDETAQALRRPTPVRSEQFLVYKILDAVTTTFLPVLARIDDDIDDIEQQILDNPDDGPLQRIFSLKKDLVAMRRVVTPMRDVFAQRRRSRSRTCRGCRGRRSPLLPRPVRQPRCGSRTLSTPTPRPAQRRDRHVPLDGRQPPGRDQQAAPR